MDGSAPIRLLPDDSNGVFAQGHVFFLRDGTLMALPFDPAERKATAEAVPVAENVAIAAHNRYGAFSLAANGTLAYWSGGAADNRELVWMDRSGTRVRTLGEPKGFVQLALSPDEKTVAATIGARPQGDVWLLDSASGLLTRFTFGSSGTSPVWSADGRTIVYARRSGATNDIVRRPITGGGEEVLLAHTINALPTDVSPDGKTIVHNLSGANAALDVGLLMADGDHRESAYLSSPANEAQARFSPDGKWMAYQSDESGQSQVYVQTIPAGGGKFQISTAGGGDPVWRRDGKELYYLDPGQKLMAVPVKINGASFEPGAPQALFTATGAIELRRHPRWAAVPHECSRRGGIRRCRTAADGRHQLAGGAEEVAPIYNHATLGPRSRHAPRRLRITAQIGEGGMGEVYRATDTKLKREVAIKVLPASVAADADRLARFQREAEVLASLNHPNIAGDLRARRDAAASRRS